MSRSSALSGFEWDEGMVMPVANAENKLLEDEVQKKQKEIVSLQNQLNENDDRVHAISEHLKNVRQELTHTQGLVNAREREIETENHLRKIASREEGRLKHEISRIQRDYEELKEKCNIYENNIFKQTQKLEEMKSQMNWDQQALEAWLEESARKDEDSMTLQKYSRTDDAKIKELTLRIERLTEECRKKKQNLAQETTETLTAQIELDKTAEEFRLAHTERQNLIAQWENTIEQMQRRDEEMDLLAAKLAVVRSEVREKEETIKDKQQFLDNESQNNKEVEKQISMTERQAAKTRLELQQAEENRDQFKSELDTLKRTVDRTATDLELTRSQVTQLKKQTVEKQKRLEASKKQNEVLVEKLKVACEAELSAEERAAQMDEMLAEEEKDQLRMTSDLTQLRDTHFRKTQELYQSRNEERNSEAEIQGSRAALRNLNSKITKLDQDSLKQQEIIYNQDFAVQQLERRINRMQGEQSNEEKMQLEAKVKILTEELEKRTSTHQLLNAQLKHLRDDVRRVKRDQDECGAERSKLSGKIDELDLHNDSSKRELRRAVNDKQNLMVDENILKLELKRLRDMLQTKAGEVLSLDKRRLQMETAMAERRHEIGVHSDMLRAQLKAVEEERSQISAELHDRISKIDKLRKRYEILMVSMAPPEGEEEKSQAYYVIKAAQDKEELQREGDNLDAAIRKSEKEIRALENTLRLMNQRNETYRKSFNKVTDTSEEYEAKRELEEQHRAVMDKYKYKRRQIREQQEDLQAMSNTLDAHVQNEQECVEAIEDKQNKVLQLNRELEDQSGKLQRVDKQNSKLSREIRSQQLTKDKTFEERDMDVRELRELNRQTIRQLGEAAQQRPDIIPALQLYFQQSGIPPPPPPGVTGPSRTSSHQSSRSSSRGGSLGGSPTGAGSVRSSMSSVQSFRSQGSAGSQKLKPITISDINLTGQGMVSPSSSRSGSSIHSVRG